MLTSTGPTYTRVAVVQLAYQPAIVLDRRSPLEDPLFDSKGGPDSLLPSRGELPEALAAELDALRRRIREAYDQQLLRKVQDVLAACRAWNVRLVIFPEYSIPWEILGGVADAAGDMVVVAGSHTVDRMARKSGIYERLVAPALPASGLAVCPVLHQGRLLALQPKLHPAIPERGAMKPGDSWAPVAMPPGIPGPMGVLVCLDFLYRESEAHTKLVAGALEGCRFLAVPSLTPHYTLPEFAGKAWEEARRYGRPVLYCDGADGGGTAIYVDEGQPYDLRRFPERAGHLEPGDEGVIVADVNLGYERPGRSTRYAEARPVVPFAEATFVYRAHPGALAYAEWLEQAAPLLARDDDDALDALEERVSKARELLLNAGALTGAAARGRRLKHLLAGLAKITRVEEVRQFTREIVLPGTVLRLPDLQRVMAGAAADAMFEWMKRPEARAARFGEVEARLRKAAETDRGGPWTEIGEAAIAAVARAVRGPVEAEAKAAPVPEVPIKVVLPAGIDPASLGGRHRHGFDFAFRARPDDFDARARHQKERLERRGSAEGLVVLDAAMTGVWNPAASDLHLLAMAEGRERVTAVAISVHPFTKPSARAATGGTVIILMEAAPGWEAWVDERDEWWAAHREAARAAIEAEGLTPLAVKVQPDAERSARIAQLVPRFSAASALIDKLCEKRLEEVNHQFEEPFARVNEGDKQLVTAALDAWSASPEQTALVLGEFGAGKSTALAVWAQRRWKAERHPLPLLASLAGARADKDAEQLLLDAATVPDSPANRAALRLLIRHRLLVPCFDGFDEMATRLDASEIEGRLSALLDTARDQGKVLVSSRTNYFPSKGHLRTSAEAALAQALGASAGLCRIEIQPFSDEQVAALVRKICAEAGAAEAALHRIAHIYDLSDLVHRPLLLGMVLGTLDQFEKKARVGQADLYEAYLKRWLEQTRSNNPECFTDEQKMEFAEGLAEQLWRSGEPSCTWQDLQRSVRMRLVPRLPEAMPVGAALLEIQGGAFFVHEGENRYRFAHKSFLEYFLARALIATVKERPLHALATRPLSREVVEFVGEVLRRRGESPESGAIGAVKHVLMGGRRPVSAPAMAPAFGTSEPPEATAEAAANALRLLLGLSRWAKDGAAWIPEGADLRKVELVKEDLREASLVRADLEGADLSAADLSGADLTRAKLVGARLVGAKLEKTKLTGVAARGADFTLAEANEVDLTSADLTAAVLRQSMWTACRWEGAKLDGAEVTGWAAPGREAPRMPGGALPVLAASAEATVVTGHRADVNAVAWHPDGTRLASAGDDRTVRIWDARAGAELACLQGHRDEVNAVAWHPGGTRLVSAGHDRTVRIWDAGTGTEVFRLEGHEAAVTTVAWHPGGTRLVSAGVDRTIRIWNAETRSEHACLRGHDAAVTTAAWHPDGTRLASAGNDRTVRIWDAETAAELACLKGHNDAAITVAWHPDGTRLASAATDGLVQIWDARTGAAITCPAEHQDTVIAVAWHPDRKRLIRVGSEGNLWIVDPIDPAAGAELVRHQRDWFWVKAVAWNPDGKRLVSAGGDGKISIWDATAGTELARLEGHEARAREIAWSPDGQRLASAGLDDTILIWDAKAGVDLAYSDGGTRWVHRVAWNPDGQRLASVGLDGVIQIWDGQTGKELARLREQGDWRATVAWHPDGQRLASAGANGTVRIWDMRVQRELVRLQSHGGLLNAVAWSPDGECLASAGDDGVVWIWDVEARREITRLEGHKSRVWMVVWHPDGKRLASAGRKGTVRIWDARTGQELTRLEGHGDRSVRAIAWHPDGKRLASAGDDKAVWIWDAEVGKELTRLEAHRASVRAVVWHPDGKRLASAADDGTVRIWDAERALLLCSLESAGPATLARSAGGFCLFGDANADRARLALYRPESGSRTALYLPLAGLRHVLYRPDKVSAALAGDLSGDDLHTELERLGWANGVPWNGEVRRVAKARLPLKSLPRGISQGLTGATSRPAAPAPIQNPFLPGRALTGDFPPGREPVIAELLTLIDAASPAILRGPRRSGKTSILYHLRVHLEATRRIRHITLESQQNLRDADDLARALEPAVAAEPSPAEALRKQLRQESRPVLLLDEVANLLTADVSVFAWLRAVGQEGTGVLLAGSHWDWVRVVEHAASAAPGSSFGNDITPVTLGPIQEADALRFLVDKTAGTSSLIPQQTARWIVDICGPWPFYLQVMGYAVVADVLAGKRLALEEPRGVYDLYEQRLLLDRDTGYFSTRFAELPERARRVLESIRTLPMGEMPVVRDLAPEDRKALRDTGLCDALGRWLHDKPFYDWIRRIKDDERRG